MIRKKSQIVTSKSLLSLPKDFKNDLKNDLKRIMELTFLMLKRLLMRFSNYVFCLNLKQGN